MEAIGLVGSIVNIVDVTAKCIGVLQTLQLRLQTANLTLTALTSQLGIFKVALDQIHDWIVSDPEFIPHYQLSLDLNLTLNCSSEIINFVDECLNQFVQSHEKLTFRRKARIAIGDESVKKCVDYLNSQSIALDLLLTALNRYCNSKAGQKAQKWLID